MPAADGRWIEMDVDGAPMRGWLVEPEGTGSHPGVVVLMEIFGVNAHIRSVTQRLAEAGYVALAPDYYHRTAPGIELAYDADGVTRGRELKEACRVSELEADIRAAQRALETHPRVSGRLGVIGFCFGGHVAFLAAASADFAATVCFYGGGIATGSPGGAPAPVHRASSISGALLCVFGEDDEGIPPAQIDQIRAALKEAHIEHDVRVYGDAGHGFFCDARRSYQPAAAADAWEKVQSFFLAHLMGDRAGAKG